MTQQKTSKAKQFVQDEKRYFAPFARIPYYDLVIDHALGSTLVDIDGKEYLDLITSASAINVGHRHPKVVAAMRAQEDKLLHYTPAYYHTEPVVQLAKKLTEITPGDFDKKVAFGLSGSDANDAIIKLARAYTKRPYIISFVNSYHGATYGSMSLSALSLNMRRKMSPLVPGIFHIPYPDVYRANKSKAEVVEECIQAVKDLFATYVPAEEVACVIMEPVAGDAGIVVPPKDYVEQLYALCKENGILFAVDEVQQGMGRTGKWWAIQHFDIEPDLLSTAKSLGSGMPISAVVGRSKIMDSLEAPAHLFTTAGNPVCCAAALATIEVIEEEQLVEKSRVDGEYAKQRFQAMQSEFDFIGDVRGIGLNLGIEIVKDKVTHEKDQAAGLKIIYQAFAKGLAIITIAKSVLRFQPALTMTRAELDRAIDTLHEVFTDLRDNKIPDALVDENVGW